jgi:hypothetical protein
MANQRGALPQQPEEVFPTYLQPAPRVHNEPAASDVGSFAPVEDMEPAYSGLPQRSLTPIQSNDLDARKDTTEETIPGFSSIQPALPSTVAQYFLPTEYAVEQSIHNWEQWTGQRALNVQTKKRLLYRPSLLAQTQIRFNHSPSASSEILWYAFVVPNLPKVPYLNWSEFQSEPFDPQALDSHPFTSRAFFGEVPQTLSRSTGFKDLQNNLVDWMYNNARLSVYSNPVLKMFSRINEDRRSFIAQVQAAARQARDAELDTTAQKFDKRLMQLEEKANIKALRLQSEREEHQGRKQEELLAGGETVWRLMKGNAYQTLSRAGRLRRMTSQSQDRSQLMEQELTDIANRLEQTEREMEDALHLVKEKWANSVQRIEEIPITPFKKDISFILFGIGWVPYWDTDINGQPVILPASSSGLSQAQDPSLSGYGNNVRYY